MSQPNIVDSARGEPDSFGNASDNKNLLEELQTGSGHHR